MSSDEREVAVEPGRVGGPSSRMVREASARLVLDHMWDVPTATGSDLMAATGLTRATVHEPIGTSHAR